MGKIISRLNNIVYLLQILDNDYPGKGKSWLRDIVMKLRELASEIELLAEEVEEGL